MQKELYGISGRKGHGKDTFAGFVKESNDSFQIAHFAGELKRIAATVFGLTHEQMYDPVIKEQPLAVRIEMDFFLDEMRAETGLDLRPAGKIATSPRELMQYIGTEYVRKAQSDYWIRKLISVTDKSERNLVPDTRFPNEAVAIHEAGGKVIKTVRIDLPPNKDEHQSETEIDKIDPDLLLGTITGNLSLPRRVAWLIASGDFKAAMMYDFRAAMDAIEACSRGTKPWEAASMLSGEGDKVSTMFTLLEYYTSGA